jgi:hypothetical protein
MISFLTKETQLMSINFTIYKEMLIILVIEITHLTIKQS